MGDTVQYVCMYVQFSSFICKMTEKNTGRVQQGDWSPSELRRLPSALEEQHGETIRNKYDVDNRPRLEMTTVRLGAPHLNQGESPAETKN